VREKGIEQRVGTAVAAVLAAIVVERFAHSGVDMLAGQKIGHPDRETDDVAALCFQALGVIGNHHDRAGLGAAHALGKLGHLHSRFRWRRGTPILPCCCVCFGCTSSATPSAACA